MKVEAIDQDTFFQWYWEVTLFLRREPDAWHIEELQDAFPAEKLIPVWIVIFGGNAITWEFGKVDKLLTLLSDLYGSRLLPYFKAYRDASLHGGGIAYGAAYLDAAKRRCIAFCERGLRRASEVIE